MHSITMYTVWFRNVLLELCNSQSLNRTLSHAWSLEWRQTLSATLQAI